MVSQSYRSVLEAEVLRDYRLPRSASFCSRYLVENRACAGAADRTEGQASPRKLGKRASTRKLATKVIEVPLKQVDSGTSKARGGGRLDLRKKGSTRLLNAGKESRRKPACAKSDARPKKDGGAHLHEEQQKQTGKDKPHNVDMRRRASSKRLLMPMASARKLVGVRVEAQPSESEADLEIAFVPDRVDRRPGKSLPSIFYGSGRTKPLAPSRSVTFSETDRSVHREFVFDDEEYQGFPEVPSYEHLEHDEYYEAMAEMVAELNGALRSCHEFTVCNADESAEFTVCFAAASAAETATLRSDPPPENNTSAAEKGEANENESAPPQKPNDLAPGDASTASDTLPSSQDDGSAESYLPDVLKSPKKSPRADASASAAPLGAEGPPPAEAVIPRTVMYRSPETTKRRRSALSVMKRTLKIISL